MENLIILNNKKVKRILKTLEEQFGYDNKLNEFAFFYKKKDSSIKIITRDVDKIINEKLNIDSLGLRIGKEISDGILLTIEGSQILGPYCDKNIVELNEKESREWLRGYDVQRDEMKSGFALLKHNKDFLGTGKVKKGCIINNISKSRRIKSKD